MSSCKCMRFTAPCQLCPRVWQNEIVVISMVQVSITITITTTTTVITTAAATAAMRTAAATCRRCG